jgi:prepilin peptidase CpaA
MAAGIALLFIPFLLGGMGAGDAKLLGAIGAFVGAQGALIVFVYTAALGGIFALFLLAVNKAYRDAFVAKHYPVLKHFALTRRWIPDETPFVNNGPKLCYGIAIAAGTFLYMTETMSGLHLLTPYFFA